MSDFLKQKFIKVVRIPKDLRTRENKFHTSMPVDLLGIVEPEKWIEYMTELNLILEKRDNWNFMNIFRYLIPFLFLISPKSYENEVKNFLNKINKELSKVNVRIGDITKHGYNEMEIFITFYK